jgi:hypothetical protein
MRRQMEEKVCWALFQWTGGCEFGYLPLVRVSGNLRGARFFRELKEFIFHRSQIGVTE